MIDPQSFLLHAISPEMSVDSAPVRCTDFRDQRAVPPFLAVLALLSWPSRTPRRRATARKTHASKGGG
jgi:hypothetical protein